MKYWHSFPRATRRSAACRYGLRDVSESLAEVCARPPRVGYYPPVRIWWWRLQRCRAASSRLRTTGGNWPPSTTSTFFCDATPAAPELEGCRRAAAAFRDGVSPRRLPGRQRLLRRQSGAALQCSSKTALAPRIAWRGAAARRAHHASWADVGRACRLVRSLGCYDSVLTYDRLTRLSRRRRRVCRLRSSAATRRSVHTHFADARRSAVPCARTGARWARRAIFPAAPRAVLRAAQVKARSAPPPQGWERRTAARMAGVAQFIASVTSTAGAHRDAPGAQPRCSLRQCSQPAARASDYARHAR